MGHFYFGDVGQYYFGANNNGRGLSQQAYHLLPKIREVDRFLLAHPTRERNVVEVHPEVSFAVWNDGKPMAFRKSRREGEDERSPLINQLWPGERERRGSRYGRTTVSAMI